MLEVLRLQPAAGAQRDRAARHILAGEPRGSRRASARRHDHGARRRARTSSCMNTVSAPCGIGAPVKMRIASPAPIALRRRAARGQAIDDRERRLVLAPRSACRTA